MILPLSMWDDLLAESNCEQDQDGTEFHPDPTRKLSANLYDIYHCCMHSAKLLLMDTGSRVPLQNKF